MSTAIETAPTTAPIPPSAEAIASRCPLGAEARQCVRAGQSADTLLGELVQKQLYIDAMRLIAYKLPQREAIWWATLCVWDRARPRTGEAEGRAFQAIVDWVRQPNEQYRRAAEAAGRAAGIQTPVGMLAMAVFFSGGSISLPDQPAVQPDPYDTAQQVAAAVVLAAKRGDAAAAQRRFVVLAAEVQQGHLSWTRKEPRP